MNKPQRKQKVILKFKDEEFITQLIDLLLTKGKVKITNFGIFEIRVMKPREGFTVGNGKRYSIPARNKVVFRPLKIFKEKFNANN